MARTLKKIPETLIIPKGSDERFLGMESAEAREWFGNGVLLAGISRVVGGYRVVRHAPSWQVLLYCCDGELDLRGDDGCDTLRPGELAWLPAGAMQYYETSAHCNFVWLHLHPEHRRWRHLRHTSFRLQPARTQDLPALFEFLYGEIQRSDTRDRQICQMSCEMILACVERELDLQEPITVTRHRQRLDALWRKVAADLAYPWTVEELAYHAAMSTPHLHAVTLQICSTTPMGMVMYLRMKLARTLLRHTQLTIDAIAQQIGYATPFSFSRAFKRQCRCTPSEYRSKLS